MGLGLASTSYLTPAPTAATWSLTAPGPATASRTAATLGWGLESRPPPPASNQLQRQSTSDINITDLNMCKLTHKGLEYAGQVSKTAGGIRCQHWHTDYPVHVPSDAIVDKMFPDGSKKAARNLCRNPTADDDGPWCYTIDEKLRNDYCDVPLCYYQDCRLSGPGMEYAGKLSYSGSERSCLDWRGSREMLFLTQRFPGGWRKSPKSRCRNPDGDPAGPWCYVRRRGGRHEEKDYCDVPFCDEQDCLVYTSEASRVHTLYTALNSSVRNLTLGLKLWHPDLWRNATVSLALSAVATPASGRQLQAWGAGVELVITNYRTRFNSNPRGGGPSRGVLTGTAWTWLWLSWVDGHLAVGREGTSEPLTVAEYASEGSILGLLNGSFLYYSIVGAGVMWSEPFCQRVDVCLVKTTSRMDFPRFWPMKMSETGYQISLFVRAASSAVVELRVSPVARYPSIRVTLSERNMTRAMLQQTQNSSLVLLAEVRTPAMLGYWQWGEFSISTMGRQMGLFWTHDMHTQPVLLAEHETVRSVRWFGLGSAHTTAHWTLFCRPKEADEVPPAALPECAVTKAEVDYAGSQWVTGSGRPCIPWTDERVPLSLKAATLPIGGSRAASHNYCRNLDQDPEGPFCLAENTTGHVEREHCRIRQCQTSVCRKAGTANDYIGQLNVTRSNRSCQRWTADMPHHVNQSYHNDTLYPEQSVEAASNYCRNPSRNAAGTWCYTTDPAVVADLCYVPDCDRPEECMTMTRGAGIGRLVYILPEWRRTGISFWLKEWDPDQPDGLDIFLRPLQGDFHYRLVIGAEDNEKVYFIYNDGKEKHLLKERTLPHLIPTGKWGGFWLKILKARVELGYQGVDNPLFSWEATSSEHDYNPAFISFTSLVGYMIAISFNCSECHVEKTSTERHTKIYPIGLWSQQLWTPRYDRLTLYMRGTGMALVALLTHIGTGDYHTLIIGKDKNKLFFTKQTDNKAWTITGTLAPFTFIEEDKWVKFVVTERFIMVTRNDVVMFQYNHTSPLLFYYFALAAAEGYIDWSANCEPPDVNLPARDGGWSPWGPWSCSVTCGGEWGRRPARAPTPRPNIYGQPCSGRDTHTGSCNTFPCGDISPDTEEMVRHRLRTRHSSKEVDEGERVALDCDLDAVERVRQEAPRAHLNWTKGAHYLQPSNRVRVTRHAVVVGSTVPEDSGVYVCLLHRTTRVSTALRIHTLAVRPRLVTESVRETRSLTLLCGSAALGAIYSGLAQRWVHEGAVWHDYGITTPQAVEELVIHAVDKSHAGEWKCIVLQPDLGFSWTTSWARVQVDPAPTFMTYLMEDSLTSPLFRLFGSETVVLVFLVAIVVVVVAVVATVVFLYLRYGTLP